MKSNNIRAVFAHPSIGDGYLAAVMLLGLPLWVTFLGGIAALVDPRYGFPVQAITAAGLYALGVHLALTAWTKPSVGSRLASAFSLVVALLLPLLLHSIL